jgi:hypothetical protein
MDTVSCINRTAMKGDWGKSRKWTEKDSEKRILEDKFMPKSHVIRKHIRE